MKNIEITKVKVPLKDKIKLWKMKLIIKFFKNEVEEIVTEVYTDLFHPEFGTVWREPNGECYLAYQDGYQQGCSDSKKQKSNQ